MKTLYLMVLSALFTTLTGCAALKQGASGTIDATITKARPLASLSSLGGDYGASGAIEVLSPDPELIILRGQLNYIKEVRGAGVDRLRGDVHLAAKPTYIAFYGILDTRSGYLVWGNTSISDRKFQPPTRRVDPQNALGSRMEQNATYAKESSDFYPSISGAAQSAENEAMMRKAANAQGINYDQVQSNARTRLPTHYGTGALYDYSVFKPTPAAIKYLQSLVATQGCNGAIMQNGSIAMAKTASKSSCEAATNGATYIYEFIQKTPNRIAWLEPLKTLDAKAKDAAFNLSLGGHIMAKFNLIAGDYVNAGKQVGSVELAELRIVDALRNVSAVPSFDLYKPVDLVFFNIESRPWRMGEGMAPEERFKAIREATKNGSNGIRIEHMSYIDAVKIVEEAAKSADLRRAVGFFDAKSAKGIIHEFYEGPGNVNYNPSDGFQYFGHRTEFMFQISKYGSVRWYDGKTHDDKAENSTQDPNVKVISW